MISAELMYEKVMHRMDMTKETKEEELQEIIRTVLEDESKKEFIPLSEKIRLSRELFNAFRRLDILQDLIEDDSITEIMVNGTENIFYEKEGKLYRTNRHFFSESRLCDVIQQIVGEANRYVNETSPIVDARLAYGSRVNVVLKPVAVNGPIMTIRKFPSKAIKMNDLIKMGSLTKEAAEFIRKIVRSKYNIFVSGGTGAGKTTFLNAMSDFIPKEERIITIEDNAELQIQGVENLVRLEAREANLEGEGAVTIRDLIKSALRMRPDRIIVGEVRGEETVDMISSAMLNGHSGSMSTGHANNPKDMLHSGGASEGECYEEYGIRCNLSEYRKFGMMLSQNLRKGTRGLTELLEREAEDAFEQRKNLAKKAGEEAGTKLMIPLFLMLIIVFAIVIVPAFFSIRI